MKTHQPKLLFLLLTLALSARSQQNASPISGDPVKIETGLVAGKQLSDGVRAYLAIPYAAPPVGEFRWREPQPVKPWNGIRPADQYCAPCAQRGTSSEDCLYLNVWAPVRTSKKLPVIVYIYGGSFNGGNAAAPSISGEVLAKKGVVYINFNYRLGVLGNLALPELTAESSHKASGNFAHLDQLAALKWISRNIERFGGDPKNVTLMGQSSGAIDVSYLQASPLAKGLIHKVVALSGATFTGGPWAYRTLKEGEQEGLNYQQKLGAKSLEELRAMPFDKLVQAAGKEVGEPVIFDGYVLPASAPDLFVAGKQNKVPALLSSCRDEGFGSLGNSKTIQELQENIRRAAGEKAAKIIELYPVNTDAEARRTGIRIAQGSGIGKQMVQWAMAQSASKSPVYISMFSRGETAGHGKDVAYWMGNVTVQNQSAQSRAGATTEYDAELAGKMSDALVAFAKTGNPSTASFTWPAYTASAPLRMDFGDTIQQLPVDKGIYFFIANPDVKMGGMGPGGARGGNAPRVPGQ